MSRKLKDLRDPSDEWIPGAVEFTNWRRMPWSERLTMGIVGQVRIVASQDAVGFTIQGGDHANWIALVKGPTGALIAIPGCKVATVSFDISHSSADFLAIP